MLPIPCLFLSGVCSSFTFRNLKACAIAVYMPTTWHSDDDVEQVYGLLDVLLDECAHNSVLPLLGGDFNACLGACENGNDSAVLGTWGFGRRNVRGQFAHIQRAGDQHAGGG